MSAQTAFRSSTTESTGRDPEPPEVLDPGPTPLRRIYRFELVKLLTQWRLRFVLLACWLVPGAVVAVVGQQSSLPSDTVFGRWLGQSGWAGPLVVLSFCCSWVLPLLTSLVAGDVFAVEDRLNTWRHLLVAVRSTRRIFAAKTAASLTLLVVLVAGMAVSASVGGVLGIGNRPLVGLGGQQLSPGSAAGLVVLAWATMLAPMLAFAAVGLLGSVTFGRSPVGLLLPVVLAFVLDLAQLLPLPVAVRLSLPSWSLLAWRGLFSDHIQTPAVLLGVVVDLVWAVVVIALAYLVFRRRDFTDAAYDGAGRRVLLLTVTPLVVLTSVTVVALVPFAPTNSGIDRAKLETALATTYAQLYRLQTAELHRPAVTEQQLAASASCDKGGGLVDDVGPGNDWRCTVSWHLPDTAAVGTAIYQLDVTPDGRFVADGDGPQSVNGFFQLHLPTGDAPNPLWQFDGTVDLLTTTPKG